MLDSTIEMFARHQNSFEDAVLKKLLTIYFSYFSTLGQGKTVTFS